jgi:hypothetical protein
MWQRQPFASQSSTPESAAATTADDTALLQCGEIEPHKLGT